ncbi:MAG: hypothetical protein JRF40_00820 [Deltaproteobacteria bacterium]|nr:hypothetical protein [Deltaproteobacteria bacterium]MBW2218024.1 hypothetical protein [Deltaproteobacteria bacterium]
MSINTCKSLQTSGHSRTGVIINHVITEESDRLDGFAASQNTTAGNVIQNDKRFYNLFDTNDFHGNHLYSKIAALQYIA